VLVASLPGAVVLVATSRRRSRAGRPGRASAALPSLPATASLEGEGNG
jgi:hypothetical protein